MLISFIFFLFLFFLIGMLSMLKSARTTDDYLMAGKSVSPFLAGLSAIATNNSGFMFIGMIGLTYTIGLSSVWLMIGWVFGDMIVSFAALKKINIESKRDDIHSFGGLLSHWGGENFLTLRKVIGIMTIFFLSIYAAAQLKAGSKAASVLLGWDISTGVIISAIIVLAYSVAGGIRASIWTDVAQSFVMIIGMAMMMFFGIEHLGGLESTYSRLEDVSEHYMQLFPDKSTVEIVLFIVGWLFGGFGVLGQPHIVIRFMSLDSEHNVNKMRLYYYGFYLLFYAATITVGLLARILLPDTEGFDPELAMPDMANLLFHDIFVGTILAAVFAAAMSTADSLILSCSASLTRDFLQKPDASLLHAKAATAIVLISASAIALSDNQSVFALVIDAWALLGSAFVPVLLIRSLNLPITQSAAIILVITGVGSFILWNVVLGLDSLMYSIAPGIIGGLLAYLLFILIRRSSGAAWKKEGE